MRPRVPEYQDTSHVGFVAVALAIVFAAFLVVRILFDAHLLSLLSFGAITAVFMVTLLVLYLLLRGGAKPARIIRQPAPARTYMPPNGSRSPSAAVSSPRLKSAATCPTCGAVLRAEAAFCSRCGAAVPRS